MRKILLIFLITALPLKAAEVALVVNIPAQNNIQAVATIPPEQLIPGPQGPQGIQGPIGLTGPQGPQGVPGPIGSGKPQWYKVTQLFAPLWVGGQNKINLPCTIGTLEQWRTVFFQEFTDVPAGTFFEVTASIVVANALAYNVELANFLCVTYTPGHTGTENNTGQFLPIGAGNYVGHNVHPSYQHYGYVIANGFIEITEDRPYVAFALRLRSRSSSATNPPQNLTVNPAISPTQGWMGIKRWN